MDEANSDILRLLKLTNPWWDGDPVPKHMYEDYRRGKRLFF